MEIKFEINKELGYSSYYCKTWKVITIYLIIIITVIIELILKMRVMLMNKNKNKYFSRWSYELKFLWISIKFCMKHRTNKIFLVCRVICQHWLDCQWPSTPEVHHGYVNSLLHSFNFRSSMQFFLHFCKIGSCCVHY